MNRSIDEFAGPGPGTPPVRLETPPSFEPRDEPARAAQAEESKTRYVFIDGLRGIAAFLVMVYHFNMAPDAIREVYQSLLPLPIHFIITNGWFGVDIFFVISGLVIAHSVGNSIITPRYFANFALRRSIRIDPPYWVALIACVLVQQFGNLVIGKHTVVFPSVKVWLANISYLQIWYGVSLLGVSWSLTHELQFYILFICLIGFCQSMLRVAPNSKAWSSALLFLCFGVTGLASAAYPFQADRTAMVTCAQTWHMFCCGVFCYLLLNRKIVWPLAAVYLIGITLLKIDGTIAPVRVGVLLATVVTACQTNKLGVWLKARPFQYFGRISYSLYLIHGIVGVPLLYFAYRVGVKSPIPLIACYLLAVTVTIGIADLMYRFVERPTVRFSKLLKSPATERGLPVALESAIPFSYGRRQALADCPE
jgi:peptidoglycan/LPS O-acetylase OafA/YrhL